MLDFSYSPKFKKDTRRAVYQGRDIMKIFQPLIVLLKGQSLPNQYRDHQLQGEWEGYRDFHVEPDWLILYRVVDNCLILERTGTHAELFGK